MKHLLSTLAGVLFAITSLFGNQTSNAQADEPTNHSAVRDYLDDSTTVVGWIDITELDIQKMGKFIQETMGDEPAEAPEIRAIQQALIQFGVHKVYWVSDLSGLVNGPRSAIVPADKPDAAALVLKSLGQGKDGEVVIDKGVVLVGSKEKVAMMQNRKGEPSADLTAILNSNKDSHGLVMTTSIQAILPVISILPKLADGDGKMLAKASEAFTSIRSVSVSGKLPPARAVVRIETKSDDAATMLAEVVNDWTARKLAENAAAVKLSTDNRSVLLKTNSLQESQAVLATVVRLNSWPARPPFNSMRHIALGMHNFHDVHGSFPPQALVDKNGKRLLSWRVLILPYLDEAPLYNDFHLDEPWDSEHNKTLIGRMPKLYRSANLGGPQAAQGKTRFVAPLMDQSVFGRRGAAVKMRDILDGTSNTLMVVEADAEHAVTWTKPEDLPIDKDNPLLSIIGKDSDGFTACMCDGSARFFSKELDAASLLKILTISGKETIDWEKIK